MPLSGITREGLERSLSGFLQRLYRAVTIGEVETLRNVYDLPVLIVGNEGSKLLRDAEDVARHLALVARLTAENTPPIWRHDIVSIDILSPHLITVGVELRFIDENAKPLPAKRQQLVLRVLPDERGFRVAVIANPVTRAASRLTEPDTAGTDAGHRKH